MAWRCHGRSNAELVGKLRDSGIITTPRVFEAFSAVDRAHFVRDKRDSYMDAPSPIGHNATISAPHMHAYAAELMEHKLKPGSKVLDVGSGSGYLLSVFAHLVQPGGRVYGIEHIPQLVEWSVLNLEKCDRARAWMEDGTIDVRVGDGYQGLPEAAPFDAIHVGAAAPEMPAKLVEQLAIGGEIILPMGTRHQQLVRGVKRADGSLRIEPLMGVMYVPLTQREKQDPEGMASAGGQPAQGRRATERS